MNEKENVFTSFLVELAVYAVLVIGYFFLCLHFISGWIKGVYDSNKTLYALAALGMMVGQGVALEALTTALLRFIRSRRD